MRPPLKSRLRRKLVGTANAWVRPGAALPEPLSTWLAAKQRPAAPATPAARGPWMRAGQAEPGRGPAASWLTRRHLKQRRSA
jgi:hypothetical protein